MQLRSQDAARDEYRGGREPLAFYRPAITRAVVGGAVTMLVKRASIE